VTVTNSSFASMNPATILITNGTNGTLC